MILFNGTFWSDPHKLAPWALRWVNNATPWNSTHNCMPPYLDSRLFISTLKAQDGSPYLSMFPSTPEQIVGEMWNYLREHPGADEMTLQKQLRLSVFNYKVNSPRPPLIIGLFNLLHGCEDETKGFDKLEDEMKGKEVEGNDSDQSSPETKEEERVIDTPSDAPEDCQSKCPKEIESTRKHMVIHTLQVVMGVFVGLALGRFGVL